MTNFTTKVFYSESDLVTHLKSHTPTFYFSSQTSTVIPYDKIATELKWDESKGPFVLGDLSKIPQKLELTPTGNLVLRGAVSWEEAKSFLKKNRRNLKTSPTEQLALILAGVATSCTGERCFGFGNLRSQIKRLKYFNYDGKECELNACNAFTTEPSHATHLKDYQNSFKQYDHFKNAPYPRFKQETDLMIGTEGQMGIVSEVELETVADEPITYVFMLLPRWEENYAPHLEIYARVQDYRNEIFSCELLDSNCMNYLKADERLGQNQDIIFLEIKTSEFERVYGELLLDLKTINESQIFEIAESKFHNVRAGVPRAIFEENSRMKVKKMGTDVQVSFEYFENLLNFYREASKLNVRYCLFGHFGDAHLHYNYMPNPDETEKCQVIFENLYKQVLAWHGSPFAEHGIGLLKQKFIKAFHGSEQKNLFHDLKQEHDPHNQFFPQGFMSL